jgi:hypothetical protein
MDSCCTFAGIYEQPKTYKLEPVYYIISYLGQFIYPNESE